MTKTPEMPTKVENVKKISKMVKTSQISREKTKIAWNGKTHPKLVKPSK